MLLLCKQSNSELQETGSDQKLSEKYLSSIYGNWG